MRITIETLTATVTIRDDDLPYSPDIATDLCNRAGDLLARTLITINHINGAEAVDDE